LLYIFIDILGNSVRAENGSVWTSTTFGCLKVH